MFLDLNPNQSKQYRNSHEHDPVHPFPHEMSQSPQPGPAATEPRKAFGVRGACSRCRMPWAIESGSKLHALETHGDRASSRNTRSLGASWEISVQCVVPFGADQRLAGDGDDGAGGKSLRPQLVIRIAADGVCRS